ncbi:FAD:protein FMN transferase [Streptococcus sobrinus]|uniref:FAD:protein FMN transferase n=1 Tax=Streptococcus sobrinus TaxID=1310 RepID=UPI000D707EDD|nr:FAD:protein FMN transferase [Streptococcus sobrinus]AWN61948.1 thiamine biosynthesis protein ApbE [Streptococcus sobrinus]AWN63819.1 thiamine biosynthesis protein ApbE [Streptococcus sobrinus]SQG20586.1 thiamine biosynthesis lipoprotein [Streptococcus sobrinus]
MLPLTNRQVQLMGTTIDTSIYHANPQPILDQVEELLHLYNHRFSANDDTSELMAINQAAGKKTVSVHPQLFDLIALGKKHSLAPGSHLNIAIGPLIQTWRIGFADAKVPSQEEIEAQLDLIDPKQIISDEKNLSVFLAKTGMKIDLGALAKGYIADRIVEFLKKQGVPAGLINLGGNVLTFGPAYHNPDQNWRIGIQNPKLPRGNHLAILKIRDQSVVTSGIYERTFTYQGKTYHHIFDSQTGYPVDCQTASLTIVSKQSVDGEIWTTRLFGKSAQEILTEISREDDLATLVVTKDNQVLASSNLPIVKN